MCKKYSYISYNGYNSVIQDVLEGFKKVETLNVSGAVTATKYTAVTSMAVLADQMCGVTASGVTKPKEQDVLIQMFTPLQSFNSLIPAGLDIQWRINFTDDTRYFVTSTTGIKPKFQITGFMS